MTKMRPITLKTIVAKLEEISNNEFNISTPRSREIILLLRELRLIKEGNAGYTISVRGKAFLNAYKRKDSYTLHNIFMDLDEYRVVYRAYIHGFNSPREIVEKTRLNNVVIDVILRLISELESLSDSHTLLDEGSYKLFERVLISKYMMLRKKYGNKYVELIRLRMEIQKDIFITNKMFKKLLEYFIRENKDRVVLAGAPLIKASRSNSVRLFGKNYVYIMINIHK